MTVGKKTGGRQKGTPNKLGGTAKENVACVFVRLGGIQAMVDWAEKNPTQFYGIYAKLLPIDMELSGKEGAPAVQIHIVKAK